MTLRYPIKLELDDNGTLLVTCPALPEVTTFGENEEDAKRRAADARGGLGCTYRGRHRHPSAAGAASRTSVSPDRGIAAHDVIENGALLHAAQGRHHPSRTQSTPQMEPGGLSIAYSVSTTRRALISSKRHFRALGRSVDVRIKGHT